MAAHAEARRQPRAVDRRAQQELAQRAAGAVEILDLAVLDLEAIGVEDLARQGQPARRAGRRRALAPEPSSRLTSSNIVSKPSPGPQVALEVDVPAEQLDQAVGHVLRQVDARGGEIEAVVDGAGAAHHLAMLRALDLGRVVAAVGVAGDPI